MSIGALGFLQASWLTCYSWCLPTPRRLGDWFSLSSSRSLWRSHWLIHCERFLCLASPERWKATLVESRFGEVHWFKWAYTSREVLIEKQGESLNPPQRGLGLTRKSLTPREKFLCHRLFLLLIYIQAIYFDHFNSRVWFYTCHPRIARLDIG